VHPALASIFAHFFRFNGLLSFVGASSAQFFVAQDAAYACGQDLCVLHALLGLQCVCVFFCNQKQSDNFGKMKKKSMWVIC